MLTLGWVHGSKLSQGDPVAEMRLLPLFWAQREQHISSCTLYYSNSMTFQGSSSAAIFRDRQIEYSILFFHLECPLEHAQLWMLAYYYINGHHRETCYYCRNNLLLQQYDNEILIIAQQVYNNECISIKTIKFVWIRYLDFLWKY